MARIRINSTPLVIEIMKVLDPDASFASQLTFIHPFDPLVNPHDKIRTRLEEMQIAYTNATS